MKTKITIKEPNLETDYFPCLFSNKDKSVVILADSKLNDRCFSGMVIHSKGSTSKTLVGTYNTGWTYSQFKRLPKRTDIELNMTQGEIWVKK